MKKYFFLFILLVSNVAFAAVCSDDNVPQSFDSIDDLLNNLEGSKDPRINLKGCTPEEQTLIKESSQVVLTQVDDLLLGISSRQNDFSNAQNWSNAKSKLECVQRKMKDASVTCKYLDGNHGSALKYIGSGFALDINAITDHHNKFNDQYSRAKISLADLTASTMLHEMTHKCGTNDKDYFAAWNNPLTTAGPHWSGTADTYQNWALWGLCLPGEECANRKFGAKNKPE